MVEVEEKVRRKERVGGERRREFMVRCWGGRGFSDCEPSLSG